MAIAIASASVYELRLTYQDGDGEEVTRVYELDGALDDNDLIALVGGFDAVSNAKIISAKVSKVRSFTGLKAAAVSALQDKISVEMFLQYVMTDPLNSTKTVTKYVTVPAYKNDLEGTDMKPAPVATVNGGTASQDALNTLLIDLGNALVYVDKRPFPNTINTGFAYASAGSGFGSVGREFDTRPGV